MSSSKLNTTPVTSEISDDENDEVMDFAEETRWDEQEDSKSIGKTRNDELEPSLCWPKDWLSKDVPTSHIRMLAVDYESRVSEWQIASLPKNVLRRSLNERAQEIAEQLKEAGVGKRPIVWVREKSLKKKVVSESFDYHLLGRTFNGRTVDKIYFDS